MDRTAAATFPNCLRSADFQMGIAKFDSDVTSVSFSGIQGCGAQSTMYTSLFPINGICAVQVPMRLSAFTSDARSVETSVRPAAPRQSLNYGLPGPDASDWINA